MIAVVTVLVAFPAGYLMKSRLAANTIYAIAYLWAFVFQTLYLLLNVLNHGQDAAFSIASFPLSYGLVALTIFMGGFGLVALGGFVRDRLGRRRDDGAHPPREGVSLTA